MANILIIEDDYPNAETLCELIKLFGHTPHSVYTAEAATARIGCGILPDIIISDHVLPGINGAEFCVRIRSLDKCANIPIIFTTASDTDVVKELTAQLEYLKPVTLLRKPFDPDELCGVIAKYLARTK